MTLFQVLWWSSIALILGAGLGPAAYQALHQRPFRAPVTGQSTRWVLEARLPGATSGQALLAWAQVLDDLPGIQKVGRAALITGYMEVAVFVETRACTGEIAERWLQRELERRGYFVDHVRSRPA
jgi:hypothetical protein